MERIAITSPDASTRALDIINRGGILIVPTDTVYGIGCDARDEGVIATLFDIKRRPKEKSIAWLCADRNMLAKYVEFDDERAPQLFALWPGAFTAVFLVRGSTETIGVRIPDYPFVTDLISKVGSPLAVTSANVSGEPARLNPDDIEHDFGNDIRVALLIDGGVLPPSAPSSVIDFTVSPPRLVREGALSREFLEGHFGCSLG
ncbi:MAG: L-threonylcarbamoyladenylate synthase [Patescibacteria group bacterium]